MPFHITDLNDAVTTIDLLALNHFNEACAQGHFNEALALLDHGDVRWLTVPVMRRTPLVRAVENNHGTLVQALIERMQAVGLDVDDEVHVHHASPNEESSETTVDVVPCALGVAVDKNLVMMTRQLLEHGADPMHPNAAGKTAWDVVPDSARSLLSHVWTEQEKTILNRATMESSSSVPVRSRSRL